ncbi:hypothetical protein DMN91_006346, partial [Ooceraea biroi]
MIQTYVKIKVCETDSSSLNW